MACSVGGGTWVMFCLRIGRRCRVGAVDVLCVASLFLAAEHCYCVLGFCRFDTKLG